MKLCKCGCGQQIIPKKHHKYYPQKYQVGHANKGKFLEKNPNWRGGKIEVDGYIKIYKPEYKNSDCHGYIFEHRYIMEQYLDRDLSPNEIVHHINEDKQDNRIENLQVLTISEHNSHHRKEEIMEGRFSGTINIMKYNNSRGR